MTRVCILCEGPTEERFVKDVLAPHLAQMQVYAFPITIGRGNSYDKLWDVLRSQLRSDRSAWVTSLVDYYGMNGKFPGYTASLAMPTPGQKAACVENAIHEDILKRLPEHHDRWRMHVQMHEFEAMLFSSPKVMEDYLSPGNPRLAGKFQAVAEAFPDPEHINNDPHTAPSKRIKAIANGYDKVADANEIAKDIGIDRIRASCPHFADWLGWLESLSPTP